MIPHSKPFFNDQELEKIIEVFNSGNIAVGKEIEEFEEKVAQYIGKDYAIATSNGTTALHLLLHSMGVTKGDEIIIPASVCPGVMHAIEYTGAVPVLSDINKEDFNISVEYTKTLITQHTKAIVVPHMFGLPSDIDELCKLGIPVIEDCAQSIGAEYCGKKVGSFGVASIFSFYATKMFTSIDGGMVLTNDALLADAMRDMRYYGGRRKYKLRFNYKMQNINAAVGLIQFEKLDSFLKERKRLFEKYKVNFTNLTWVRMLNLPTENKQSSYYRFVLKIADAKVEYFTRLCKKFNITLGDTIFADLSCFAPRYFKEALPNTQMYLHSTFSFPLYPGINESELDQFFQELNN